MEIKASASRAVLNLQAFIIFYSGSYKFSFFCQLLGMQSRDSILFGSSPQVSKVTHFEVVGWTLKTFNQRTISGCIKVLRAARHQTKPSVPANHQSSPGLTTVNVDNWALTAWNHVFISSIPFPFPSLLMTSGRLHRYST